MREWMRLSVKRLQAFQAEESGQDLIEYALIAALIALGSVAGMSALANQLNTVFNTIGTKLTSYVS